MTFETPFGPATYALDGRGALLHFTVGKSDGKAEPGLSEVARQVSEYFAGTRQAFDLALAPQGSDFQKRVWAELCRIPFGETISYSELAERVGLPGAARAVGRANATNPIWLIVPCHRVIGANGSLTGYAGGIELKKNLLAWEQQIAGREFALTAGPGADRVLTSAKQPLPRGRGSVTAFAKPLRAAAGAEDRG